MNSMGMAFSRNSLLTNNKIFAPRERDYPIRSTALNPVEAVRSFMLKIKRGFNQRINVHVPGGAFLIFLCTYMDLRWKKCVAAADVCVQE